jgi:hypothetical protein
MFRTLSLGLVALGWLVGPAPLTLPSPPAGGGEGRVRGADHFAIDLEARTAKASRTAHAEAIGRGSNPKTRGVLELKAGDRVTFKWKVTNIDPKDVCKDVVVHCFLVKEEAVGQQAVPKMDRGVVAENAMTRDFKPKDKAEGELTITIENAGCYLLRVETIGAAKGLEDHEYFAALDLDVR